MMAEWDGDRMVVAYRQPESLGRRATRCATSSSRCPRTRCACWCATSAAASACGPASSPTNRSRCGSAKVLKRPVKWRAERSEEFAAATAGRDQLHKVSLALDKDGKILALRMEAFANVGAYPSGAGIAIPLFVGPKVSTGTYDVPLVDLKITCVLTNTATIGAYRGAGRPECLLDLERLMDTASRQIGIDPAELRRRNFVTPAQMPYTTAMGEKYDSGDFNLFLTKTLEAADWDGFPARKAEAEKRGKLYGRGLASYVEWTSAMVMNEMAHYEVKADGKVVIWMGTQGMGQGLQTSFTQLASELLGIDASQIEIAMGDSDRVGGVGSMGSRSAYIGGSAVLSGSEKLVDKGKELAADALEASTADIVYAGGRFTIAGTDRGIGLGELAAKQPDKRIFIENVNTVDGIAWPNGAHVGEVEIDPETGRRRAQALHHRRRRRPSAAPADRVRPDPGRLRPGHRPGAARGERLRPRVGPAHHRLVHGLRHAAGRRPSRPSTTRSTTACRPRPIRSAPRAWANSGAVGSTPTVMNAIMDALWPLGVRNIQMPATPLRVWQAIQETPHVSGRRDEAAHLRLDIASSSASCWRSPLIEVTAIAWLYLEDGRYTSGRRALRAHAEHLCARLDQGHELPLRRHALSASLSGVRASRQPAVRHAQRQQYRPARAPTFRPSSRPTATSSC